MVLSEHDLDVVRLYVFAREANLSVPSSSSLSFFPAVVVARYLLTKPVFVGFQPRRLLPFHSFG